VAGRNSFTEGQAKSKIEEAGYSNVTELKKDDAGVWHGKASKGSSKVRMSTKASSNVGSVAGLVSLMQPRLIGRLAYRRQYLVGGNLVGGSSSGQGQGAAGEFA
jgi:hypothetical protein